MLSRPNTSRILHRVGGQRRVFQAALQASPAHTFHDDVMATQIRPHPKVVQNTALTPRIRRESYTLNVTYVCIDAPRVLGVLYIYIYLCTHVLCMYVSTLFGALFVGPIAIRRADRRTGWYRCVANVICTL